MSLKRLTTEQMSNISTAWLNPEELFPLFDGDDRLKMALPEIETVHNGLFLYIKEEQKLPLAILALIELAQDKDVRHDSLVRGFSHTVKGRIELARTLERKKILLDLLTTVLPMGISITTRSYPEEAGAAELLENRLTAEDKALLQSITVNEEGNGENLLALVEELISVGKELGVLDRRIKEALREWEKTQGPSTTKSDAQKARKDWIQMVNNLEALFNLLKISAEVVEKIMRPVREAEAVADRRYAQKKAREEEKKKAKEEEEKKKAQSAATPAEPKKPEAKEEKKEDPPKGA